MTRGWHPNEPMPVAWQHVKPGDSVAGAICLPYPPSVNHMWRRARNGRVYLSEEARTWREQARWYLRTAGVVQALDGPVAVTIIVFRPRRRGDIDNIAKAILDALNEVAYLDDGQVVQLSMTRYDDARNPRVLVRVNRVGADTMGR